MKRLAPITERMASRIAGEQKELKSYIKETSTVFVNEHNVPVFEKVEFSNPFVEGQTGLVSYFAYVDVNNKEGS